MRTDHEIFIEILVLQEQTTIKNFTTVHGFNHQLRKR